MFTFRKAIVIFTALAVCFAANGAVSQMIYSLGVETGKWRSRPLLPKLRGPKDASPLFEVEGPTCLVTYGYKDLGEDLDENDGLMPGAEEAGKREWYCKPVEEEGGKECATKGVALYRNKKGELRLDHYRTRFGYRKNALVHFCAGEGVKMRKMIGKPVYFYWKAPKGEKKSMKDLDNGKWDGYYLGVDTKQFGMHASWEWSGPPSAEEEDA